MNAAAAAHQFSSARLHPEQSSGIVGNLVHESGMNPFARAMAARRAVWRNSTTSG